MADTEPDRRADDVRTAEEGRSGPEGLPLFHEFNDAMARLYKKYGVIYVQEQCRSWVEFIDGVRAKQEARTDGS